MSTSRLSREKVRQLGQFMTPAPIAAAIVSLMPLSRDSRVLEPSFGEGAFVIPLIEKLLTFYEGTLEERLDAVLTRNIFGVELDPEKYAICLHSIRAKWGYLPSRHNLVRADFFEHWFTQSGTGFRHGVVQPDDAIRFDIVIGNPPFGGSIRPDLQDRLDRAFGFRNGFKIKKETYSFFIVKSLDLLRLEGRLVFVCGDTFMTINTMKGLRESLMVEGETRINALPGTFDETSYPMVVIDFHKGEHGRVFVNDKELPVDVIRTTGNSSWMIPEDLAEWFVGPKLGDILVASSGMTIGANELFVREIRDGTIVEPYEFEFFDDPITVERERARARLGSLSARKIAELQALEADGATRRNVVCRRRPVPIEIRLPHPDYRYYNKAMGDVVFAPPTHVVYWKDDGDAVLTFKKNGNWYLHGVGGKKFFGREGVTWQLISSRINARYLPAGYILDSGAPVAFLRNPADHDELFFIIGWLLSPLCRRLLKEVINHTRNIQGKDVERLPYPFWVPLEEKTLAIDMVRRLIDRGRRGGRAPSQAEIATLTALYA